MATDEADRTLIATFERRFRDQKAMTERAVAQVPDDRLHVPLDANTNALAVILKHMSGNLRSRFTDFLTSDGEKGDRDRDSEFVDDPAEDRAAIMARWERGWSALFDALAALGDADLVGPRARTVEIRGQPHAVLDALLRALAHQAYHVGQVVQLSRHLAGDRWQTLTIPRGGSEAFNDNMARKRD